MSQKHGLHFAKIAGEYLGDIERFGDKIEAAGLPEVWQIIQEWTNQGKDPGAIADVLEAVAPYIKKKFNQQGYIRAVMQNREPKYRNRGFVEEHKKIKIDFGELVDDLKTVHAMKKRGPDNEKKKI